MNKKLKKMLAAVSAVAVCAVSMTSMTSGASNYYVNDMGVTPYTVSFISSRTGLKYVEWQEMNDYFEDSTYKFFISEDGSKNLLLHGSLLFALWGWFGYDFDNDEDAVAFKKYLTDNNIEYEESSGSDWINIKPVMDIYKTTADEYFQLAKKIKEDTGLIQNLILPDSAKNFSVTDVVNALPEVTLSGDANCDEEVTISDSVLIMQTIVNPDEFKMTMQGKANADVVGDGDGVTLNDAFEIQEMSLYN